MQRLLRKQNPVVIHVSLNRSFPLALTLENSQNITCFVRQITKLAFCFLLFLWLNYVFAKHLRRRNFYSYPYMRAQKSSHCWQSNGNVKQEPAEPSFILGIYNSATTSRNLEADGENNLFFFYFFLSLSRCTRFHLSVLLTERPAVCGGGNGIKAND